MFSGVSLLFHTDDEILWNSGLEWAISSFFCLRDDEEANSAIRIQMARQCICPSVRPGKWGQCEPVRVPASTNSHADVTQLKRSESDTFRRFQLINHKVKFSLLHWQSISHLLTVTLLTHSQGCHCERLRLHLVWDDWKHLWKVGKLSSSWLGEFDGRGELGNYWPTDTPTPKLRHAKNKGDWRFWGGTVLNSCRPMLKRWDQSRLKGCVNLHRYSRWMQK